MFWITSFTSFYCMAVLKIKEKWEKSSFTFVERPCRNVTLVGAAVHLWPCLQGSIPKFAINKPKLSLLLERMTVIWYSGCDTMLPSTHLWKVQATLLILRHLNTIRLILLVFSPILCNYVQVSFWGSSYSHRITILLHFPVLLPLHRYPRLHLRVESLRPLDPLSKKKRKKKGWKKKKKRQLRLQTKEQGFSHQVITMIFAEFFKEPCLLCTCPNRTNTAKNFASITSPKFAENRMALSEDLSMLDLVSW